MNRKIVSYAQTDLGRKREENEDNFVWVQNLWNKSGVAMVGAIDGVGGYEGGAEAAEMSKEIIERYLHNFSFGGPLQLLKEAVITANNKIFQHRQDHPALSRMSCVLSIAILDAEKEMMYVAHVGDSRGYVYRNDALLKITKDHSTVGIKEDSGYLTEAEAMQHPRRNEINKMVGELLLDPEDKENYFDTGEHSFLPGDIVLFCSDGLTDLVTKAQIITILDQPVALPQKAQALIDKANELGGKDNITVVLATYTAKPARSAGAKGGRKKAGKNTIEIPITENNTEMMETNTATNKKFKKKIWLVPAITAFIIGFLANWTGTKNLFTVARVPVTDTLPVTVDSIPITDTAHHSDTLINATDTLYKDSTKKTLQGY